MSDVVADYDGTAKGTTATTDVSGATIDITYTDSSGAAVLNNAPINAGVYTATANIAVNSKYEGTKTATLTINKASATVAITRTSQRYDAIQAVGTSASVGNANVVVNIKTEYDGKTALPTTAGHYNVVSTIEDDNYEGSATATLTIGKISIDGDPVTYDGTNQIPTVTVTPNDLSTTITYDNDSVEPKNAGTYAVKVVVADDRYNETVNQNFVIIPKPVTVTAVDATKEYGEDNPALTVSYSGFVAGEDESDLTTEASAATTADVNSGVSDTYEITASGAVGSNYSFTYVKGKLSVTQMPLL